MVDFLFIVLYISLLYLNAKAIFKFLNKFIDGF